jgi:hypothetical protein
MRGKSELFDIYIKNNINNINRFIQKEITYWLELEYFLVDNDYKVVPQSANKFLRSNKNSLISWESWTFQLEISSNHYIFEKGSIGKLSKNILDCKSEINAFCNNNWLSCISTWLPPYIDKNFQNNQEFLNQDNKYKIEREYWLKNNNNSYFINTDWTEWLLLNDSCANLALINWIHINIKLRNVEEFISFHNYWLSLMPFFYWLSSNASFLNWKIKNKHDARLNVWLLSDNYLKASNWQWTIPYLKNINDYFDILNSFDFDFEYLITDDEYRNAFELKRESCWFFQQFKILDNGELLYEYRPLTIQITSKWWIYLWVYTILTILYFINTYGQEIKFNKIENINKYMNNVSDNWVQGIVKLFDNFDELSVDLIYNYYKNDIIKYWIENWYINDLEWKLIIEFLDLKVWGKFDIVDYDSLTEYFNSSKL